MVDRLRNAWALTDSLSQAIWRVQLRNSSQTPR
jgi:hypothetical protein